MKLICTKLYFLITQLQDSHPKFFGYLKIQLVFSTLLTLAGIIFIDIYLDTPAQFRQNLWIKTLPFFLVIFNVAAIFIYLLPGLCDPENETERRVPFLVLTYIFMILAELVILCINERIIDTMNGYILYSPLFIALAFQLISILPDVHERRNETIIVSLLFI
jgi:hypothetical protein